MDTLYCDLQYGEDKLTAVLQGSVDHHTVRRVREEIDSAIARYSPKEAVIDLHKVEFMDSSGLGLILGRYARLNESGAKLSLRGVTEEIMKIVCLAGIDKFIPVEKEKKGGVLS